MTVDELIKTYQAAGDSAYGDYSAMLSKDVCKGEDIKIAHGVFGRTELSAHRAASGFLEKHRACVAFVQALKSISY